MRDFEQEFRRLKTLAEDAVAQVDDDAFFRVLSSDDNSVAILVKHIGGNLRSRWTDFLTTDGEKPDRHRDHEFIIGADESRHDIMKIWDAGWATLVGTLDSLGPDDWDRTIYIRRQPHSVIQATVRCMGHIACHVGQIVLLAKHHAGESWSTLSIPRGGSEKFNAELGAPARERAGEGGTS